MNNNQTPNNQTAEANEKNFIRFSSGLKAKTLDNLSKAMEYIENTPTIQARAFMVQEEPVRDPRVHTFVPTQSLQEQTAGVCILAFGPLAILLMAQINAMPELFNQLQVMHMREQQHEASKAANAGATVKPSSLIV